MQENAIVIKGLKKEYRLGQIGGGTLTADLQSWWARVRHQEDPNSKIGTDQRLLGQRFWALNGIDLEIKKGEAIGIIGGNGAGKSTMLKILSRITAPTEGSVDIYGRIASMLEVGTGFSPEMTGRENIYMNGAILGMTKAEIDAKMEDIIEFSEVRDFIDTPVKRYSSGMYVKLAFSVAAHLDSEIMIMDEVLAVGDMAFQKKCLDKMRDAATVQGKTVLYVSHNMNTIRKLCDRCIVLDKGRVVFNGDVERAIEIYLGSKSKSDSITLLKDIPRDREFSNHPLTMERFCVSNNVNAVYPLGSFLHAELSYTCERSVKDAYLRVIIKRLDGSPITMATVDKSFSIEKEKRQCLALDIDISRLVPGTYTLSPVFYEVNEFGGNVSLDGLKDVYCFEIATALGFNNNMEWLPQYWGNVYSAPLAVQKIACE